MVLIWPEDAGLMRDVLQMGKKGLTDVVGENFCGGLGTYGWLELVDDGYCGKAVLVLCERLCKMLRGLNVCLE